MTATDERNGLTLPSAVSETVALHVKGYGAKDVETGAFLLAPRRRANDISVVAFAGEEGIVRGPKIFRVSGRAIGNLFGWADENDLRVRALIHSHQGCAFLSRTDLEHGFAVEGFTTVIVPSYSAPSPDPADWAWWRYEAGEWRDCASAAVTNREARFVVFDEGGIREY